MLRQMQNLTSTVKRMRNVVKFRKDIFLKLKVLSFSQNNNNIRLYFHAYRLIQVKIS